MGMPDTLNHLSLKTGRVYRVRYEEVADTDMTDLCNALFEALPGPVDQPIPLPGTPGYCLTTDGTPESFLTFDLRLNSNLLSLSVTCWCARLDNEETQILWGRLKEKPRNALPTRESRCELDRWERVKQLRTSKPEVRLPTTLAPPWLVTAELYAPLPHGQNVDHHRELEICARHIAWCWLTK